MSRFDSLRGLLQEGKFFKLICGAGNENSEEVRRLAVIYSLAGATGFDVSATPSVVSACKSGIDTALSIAPQFGVAIPIRPFITVSVGMPGDHHVRKALIDPAKCVSCNLCIPVCPTDAIPSELKVIRELCIGCGACEAACPPKVSAINYEHDAKGLRETLPACLAAGAENIELHAAIPDNETVLQEWKIVNAVNPQQFNSMCLDRLHLGNFQLIDRIKAAIEISGDRTIIQADGLPMSGTKDDFNTTLQAIATADIIAKELRLTKKNAAYRDKFHILLSGGTNGYTAELARLVGVRYGGLSMGTHARKTVQDRLVAPDFDADLPALRAAVDRAKTLVSR